MKHGPDCVFDDQGLCATCPTEGSAPKRWTLHTHEELVPVICTGKGVCWYCYAPSDHQLRTKIVVVPLSALREAENRGNLHANINMAVSDALGQGSSDSWHDLGAKVAALKQKLADAEAKLNHFRELFGEKI